MVSAAHKALPASSKAELRGRLDAGLPAWLLIDPMLGEPFGIDVEPGNTTAELQTARERVLQRPVTVIELPSVIDLPARLQPYLVALQSLMDPWIDESLDVAEQERDASLAGGLAGKGRAAHRVGGWLQSDSSAQALAIALAGAARLRTTAPASARYLRIADRRTLDWLVCIVGADRIAAAVPTLKAWSWLDACANIACIGVAGGTTYQALNLGPEPWRRFESAHLVHPTLARWQGERRKHGHSCDGTASENLQRCEQAVRQAHAASRTLSGLFTQDDDFIAWAALALLRPGFDTDQRWLEHIANPARRVVPFDRLCHDVADLLASSQRTPS